MWWKTAGWRSSAWPYFSQPENQQEPLDLLQNTCFCKISAVIRRDCSTSLCLTCYLTAYLRYSVWTMNQISTCFVCGILHLSTLTWQLQSQTARTSLFYNWESKQKMPEAHRHTGCSICFLTFFKEHAILTFLNTPTTSSFCKHPDFLLRGSPSLTQSDQALHQVRILLF